MLTRKTSILLYASLCARSSSASFLVVAGGRPSGTTTTTTTGRTTTTTTTRAFTSSTPGWIRGFTSSPTTKGTSSRNSRFMSTDTASDPASSSSSSSSPILLRGKLMIPIPDAIQLHGETNVKFIDGSWFLMGRNARTEFQDPTTTRIANAYFFDIDDIADKTTSNNNDNNNSNGGGMSPSLLHMMPPRRLFAAAMDAMGISNTDHLIVYGTKDCPFVHRAWFQIRNMGHGKDYTHLLDGSLADWIHHGGPIEEGEPTHPIISSQDLNIDDQQRTSYQATDPQGVVDKEVMKQIILATTTTTTSSSPYADSLIIDVRAPERYRGEVEEPRPGLRRGHMPGAKNIFFKDLLCDTNVLQFKQVEELKSIIAQGGVDWDTDKQLVIHCGSGATACALVAALELCGRDPSTTSVYDASWSEWGALSDTPIEKDGQPVP